LDSGYAHFNDQLPFVGIAAAEHDLMRHVECAAADKAQTRPATVMSEIRVRMFPASEKNETFSSSAVCDARNGPPRLRLPLRKPVLV
jgi:hypothetical protein